MKNLFTLILALCIYSLGYSQSWTKNLENKNPKDITFVDVQKAFNEYHKDKNVIKGYYFVNGEKIKAPGWKQFKRWEWNMDMRVDPITGKFPTTTTSQEWDKFMKSNPDSKSTAGNWVQMGPNSSGGGYAGIGRVNCIAFHPTDPNTYWVGTPSGGLWRTTDDGSTWDVLTDQNDVLGVSDIAIPSDFATSNTIYIATGDRDGGSSWTLSGGNWDDNESIGVLKSTDGGATWNPTGLTWNTSQGQQIGRLLIHPANPQILIFGAYDGIYKTTDGGTNWSKVHTSGYVIDMEFKPGEPTVVYASTQGGTPAILKSTNTGDSWTSVYTFGSGSSRTDIAVTPAASDHLYVLVSNTSGGLYGVYKSRNSAGSFTQTFSGTGTNHSLLGYYSDGSGDNVGQGGYDLALAVAPNDTNIMFLGGINTWKSTNNGYNWTINNMWTSYSGYNYSGAPEVHADKHILKFYNNTTVFEGNDGGIYKSTDIGANWVDKTNEMVISQLYRIGVDQSNGSNVIAGLQDNGTKLIWESTWYDVKGGDGMECIIDPTDNNVQYGTYVEGEIERTLDLWNNTEIISNNIADGGGGWWVAPYTLDPNNSQIIYVGYADVWKSTNRGDSFTKISTMNSSDKLRSLAVAPGNSSVIYAADKTHIWKTTNGGGNWTAITGTLPVSSTSITYIAVHNSNPDIVWVTFGGYNSTRVYESTNGGTSWTNISDGLPTLPVFCIAQNKLETTKNHLYVGTDRGVFFKNGSDNWIQFSTGLPNVMVTELDIYYDSSTPTDSRILAATFGRGLWESDLYDFTMAEIVPGTITGTYTVTPNTSIAISMPFSITTTFTGNTFTAYLSNASGDFTSETIIGALTSDVAGTITGTIPANTPSGSGYKIRIKSSNPVYTSSSSNSFQISLVDEIVPGTLTGPFTVTPNTNKAMSIPFTINTTFTANTFTAYLSDASGDFTSEINIGTLTSDVAGAINGSIPANTPSGSGYKIRIKSSNPVYTSSSSNAFQITLVDEIETGTITGSYVVTSTNSASINIPFTKNTTFTDNTFTAFLSDAIGDFTSEISIGTLVANNAGTITGTIPAGTPTGSGYKVRVKSSNPAYTGTSSNAFQITLNTSTEVIDLEENTARIYPLPAKNILNIEFDKIQLDVYVQVLDLSGKTIFKKYFKEIIKEYIEVDKYSAGIYIIQIKTDGQVYSKRIAIQ
ncbi:MAG: T9SS type A sorting domain-containing protein [Bacteroidales bacterium]